MKHRPGRAHDSLEHARQAVQSRPAQDTLEVCRVLSLWPVFMRFGVEPVMGPEHQP